MGAETLELQTNLDAVGGSGFPRVIRRDLPGIKTSKPRVVPWIGQKIEKAVNAACVAVGHEAVGKQLRVEAEFRVKKQCPLFIHIEQVQDLVEGLLIELNY